MNILLKNVRAILPCEEKKCDIRISDGIIAEINENIEPQADETIKECNGNILMPGFIDTHIHGGISKSFFDENMDFTKLAYSFAKRGTTALLPTFSCMPLKQFEEGVKRTLEFARKNKYGSKLVGIHAEGPFLNPVRAGGMAPQYMVFPDVEYFNTLADICDDTMRIITLAPELKGAFDVIDAALKRGVAVSAGHTNATYDLMKQAIDAGVTRVTHTFNAARPINHREPGVLGAAFGDSRVNCEAICDFGHLHPETVKLILKQKGTENFTLVSDYSDKFGYAAKGEGEHTMPDGTKYYIKNGVAWTQSGNVISNSNDILVGVRNLYSIGVSLCDISVVASQNPAKVSGVFDRMGSIEVGKTADLVLLDEELSVLDTYVDGQHIN